MFRGDRETLRRLHSVRADRLEELGRVKEAKAAFTTTCPCLVAEGTIILPGHIQNE